METHFDNYESLFPSQTVREENIKIDHTHANFHVKMDRSEYGPGCPTIPIFRFTVTWHCLYPLYLMKINITLYKFDSETQDFVTVSQNVLMNMSGALLWTVNFDDVLK